MKKSLFFGFLLALSLAFSGCSNLDNATGGIVTGSGVTTGKKQIAFSVFDDKGNQIQAPSTIGRSIIADAFEIGDLKLYIIRYIKRRKNPCAYRNDQLFHSKRNYRWNIQYDC